MSGLSLLCEHITFVIISFNGLFLRVFYGLEQYVRFLRDKPSHIQYKLWVTENNQSFMCQNYNLIISTFSSFDIFVKA